jgi:uncharacterized membrane protein YdbT with pleckstrin-like domain
MENIQSDESIVVREAFIIPACKVVFSQFILGNIYFMLINFYQIESLVTSMVLFNALEGAQILLSVAIFLAWYHRFYEISTEEIEVNTGLILQKNSSYSLEHLESVTFKKTVCGLMFNYGDVKISLHYGTDSKVIHIKNVKDPARYAKFLNQKLKAGGVKKSIF